LVLNPEIYDDYGVIGRVEVWSDTNGWGTVCDDVFDSDGDVAATIFCSAFGYTYGYALRFYGCANNFNQPGYDSINMDDVTCYGGEATLFDCSYITDHNCGHSEDVGVYCYN